MRKSDSETAATRAGYARQRQEEARIERGSRLARRLDWAIGLVIVLIILVLVVLFKL